MSLNGNTDNENKFLLEQQPEDKVWLVYLDLWRALRSIKCYTSLAKWGKQETKRANLKKNDLEELSSLFFLRRDWQQQFPWCLQRSILNCLTVSRKSQELTARTSGLYVSHDQTKWQMNLVSKTKTITIESPLKITICNILPSKYEIRNVTFSQRVLM